VVDSAQEESKEHQRSSLDWKEPIFLGSKEATDDEKQLMELEE